MKQKMLTIAIFLAFFLFTGSVVYAADYGLQTTLRDEEGATETEQPTEAAPADSGDNTETPAPDPGTEEEPIVINPIVPIEPTTETPQPSTEQQPSGGGGSGSGGSGKSGGGSKSSNTATSTDALKVELTTVTNGNGMVVFDTSAILELKRQMEMAKQDKIEVQQLINELMQSQNDFISVLREFDEKIIEYQERIDELTERQEIASNTIIDLSQQLEQAKAEEEEQYELLKSHIRIDYENNRYTYLDALFNAISFSTGVSDVEYIRAIEAYDQKLLDDLTEKRRSIANKSMLLETLNEDMEYLKETYSEQQDAIELLSEAKEKQIQSYQKKIDEAEEAIATIEELEKQQDAKLLQLEMEYRQKLALSTAPRVVYTGGSLAWPMPSSTQVTSGFGPRWGSVHRGTDIACPVGSPVVAVAPGTVIYTGYMGTGGMAVLIDHGNGLTTNYYHLSAYNCQPGDVVTTGQVIAFSGNTGNSTGPHLHFGVRVNGEYVDPMSFYR